LSASPDLCGATKRYLLYGPGGPTAIVHEGDCNRSIAGLAPGQYGVELSAGADHIVFRQANVLAQQVTSLQFAADFAAVSGTVLLNGKPADGLQIEFHRDRTPTAITQVRGGQYALEVGEPGSYVARLRDPHRSMAGTATASQDVTLVAGPNNFDLSIEGGVIEVKLLNWERIEPAQIKILGVDTMFGSEVIQLEKSESEVTRITGLPFGKYRLSASEPVKLRTKTSAPATVELLSTKPEAKTTLDLKSDSVTVTVRDEGGRPIHSPLIKGDEIAEGVYVVPALSGVPIVIRATGFAPVCRLARADQSVIDVVMTSGRSLEIHVTPGGPNFIPSLSFLGPGSDCPISIVLMAPAIVGPTQVGVSVLRVPDFWPAGQVTVLWRETGQTQVVQVPPSGPWVLRQPGEPSFSGLAFRRR
jgi:hypothetical protein